ncbi:oligopeptide-binding protein AppA precursor [Variibacter gotjawalensis]|uniref:Oligopeptide-binding protein AppA n=1 Tax=Variibacter gotjawalensis TaxID=1333996 RepID=A0A0S3PXJ3_9BRAD|nr:extracellular solute-binding protein [Variibacter gotjawalensis]NIK46469.1 peptide/nickel transport system substrate-binding protein [Variibacter gotjawalensis]RZS48379.1 peptide/nickel transport system substrate-binding protein [Variibacter gotjawalensis]BAT60637.1 oligopeptide-binding protein AppA precursor [Variibacter gotjawalensis]
MAALTRRNLLETAAAVAVAAPLLRLPSAHASAARHAIAMHGAPALGPDFKNFAYANPQSPKGGRLTLGLLGTFDSLNPFIVRGLPVQQIRSYVVESLLVRGQDEAFTLYAGLAESIETDAARTYATFTIHPNAHFSDGKPVTPDDVIFSWRVLQEKGRPNFRTYYSKVAKTDVQGRSVRFDFGGAPDRELPLILGLMPILPRHAFDEARFDETTLAPIIGSGPYRVGEVRPGERVTLTRNPDYWGRDLAINRGFWNFDEIRIDFYRDANTHMEAFARGLYDVRPENDPARWEQAYDFASARDGQVIKDILPNGQPKGMAGLVFNTRRPLFADIRVREALTILFDFEWINRNFYFDLYRRTGSYFSGSDLSAFGRPADARERALLGAFPKAVRKDILDGTWKPPQTDGSGRDRAHLALALKKLKEAGWVLTNGVLRNQKTQAAFTFEILVATKEQERLALTYARDLARAGIKTEVRIADPVQFEARRSNYDFDMLQYHWGASLSPGNEQAFYWGSASADQAGTRNYMGAKEPAIDAMIAKLLAAEEREDFVAAVRALDRVLLSGFYVVPLFYLPDQWVARQAAIKRPEKTSLNGYLFETWWRQPA